MPLIDACFCRSGSSRETSVRGHIFRALKETLMLEMGIRPPFRSHFSPNFILRLISKQWRTQIAFCETRDNRNNPFSAHFWSGPNH